MHTPELQRGRVPEHAESAAANAGSAFLRPCFNEAACRSTRRAARRQQAVHRRGRASTRPRAGARGEGHVRRLGHGSRHGASTRPRAGARGERSIPPPAWEVNIMLQRGRVPEHAERDTASGRRRMRAACFNEAACRSTRRARQARQLARLVTKASTRPRAGARGEDWGRMGAQGTSEGLQRGRVPEHAERSSVYVTTQYGVIASTRPRAGARGEIWAYRLSACSPRELQRGRVPEHAERRRQVPERRGQDQASTRPRAGARGESAKQLPRRSTNCGFNEAACRSTRRGGGGGRGTPLSPRFNEAACRSTRRASARSH